MKMQGRSLREIIEAKPTADYDAKWGGFVVDGKRLRDSCLQACGTLSTNDPVLRAVPSRSLSALNCALIFFSDRLEPTLDCIARCAP